MAFDAVYPQSFMDKAQARRIFRGWGEQISRRSGTDRRGFGLLCGARIFRFQFAGMVALEPLADRLFSFDALLRNMVDQVFFGRTEAA